MTLNDMATFRSYPHNASGSQESLASYTSGTALANSSNASQATADTDVTSPLQTDNNSQNKTSDAMLQKMHAMPQTQADQAKSKGRLRTPENQADASRDPSTNTSPMSLSTPLTGHKRMASGEIKRREANVYTSPAHASRGSTARAGSVGSAGTKASEVRDQPPATDIDANLTPFQVAGTLKERLTYAMTKVQHGWEHHNIDQVERLAAAAAISPRTVISPRQYGRGIHASPRAAGFPARILTEQISHHSAPYHDGQIKSAPLMRPRDDRASSDESMSPPTKRRIGHDSVVSPMGRTALAPAADLPVPASPHRQHARHGSQGQNIPSSPSQRVPTTPKSHRPATIRTQTQTKAAEQEAMDALLLMGSPSNGAFPRGSQQSSAAQSPNRRNVAPSVPRQALQYRSESNDSITSGSSLGPRDPHRMADIMRQRGAMLDQIEAES
ncbi:hypothetical protein BDZ85DRAFT_262538 [Elsinoe ampelina]|uniref:Uncharacterized protein n=1 Tax=Elsinoe ampelina TaxID=302913 RepID=A0A6A6GAT8_9PEZI|nr:hypothetical protein BDZ85DRAFT_262538 [Elsinoe ampelina]